MGLPYWIEYIRLNAQAKTSFIEWIEKTERAFNKTMQDLLIKGDTQQAVQAALKLSIYQEIANKFKVEVNEQQSAAEYAERQKGGS